jgi:hypothetical protein
LVSERWFAGRPQPRVAELHALQHAELAAVVISLRRVQWAILFAHRVLASFGHVRTLWPGLLHSPHVRGWPATDPPRIPLRLAVFAIGFTIFFLVFMWGSSSQLFGQVDFTAPFDDAEGAQP